MNPTSCFAIAYVLSGPTDGSRWTVWVPSIVLPIIGIVIVLFCLGSFIFPYGEKFKSTNQVFKGYGLDLEISLLTVFVLLGVALSLTKVGIFLYTSARDVSTLAADNNRLLVELKNAKDAADRAGRFVVYTSMKLPTGVNLNAVDITKLQCHYLLASSGNWVNQDVTQMCSVGSQRGAPLKMGGLRRWNHGAWAGKRDAL